MALIEKKQQLGQEGVKAKPEKISPPPEKKDTSGFGGRPYLSGEQFREWLRKPELYSRTGILESKRLAFEKAIRSKYGRYLQRGEAEKIKTDLERGRIKLPPGVRKKEAAKLMKEFLGKK